jgi:glycosyltransferase involved in cell wall biosynthesis
LRNFIPDAELCPDSRAGEGEFALAAGRLTEEKGFDTAIAAARAARVPLVIAGAGPDEPRLRTIAAGAEVRFTGRLERDALSALRRRAAVVLAPSRWEEPCPYAVLEALAAGVPVLTSDRGGLPELVGEDSVVPARDEAAWTARLSELWQSSRLRAQRGAQSLQRARERFGENRYYEKLMGLYGHVST